MRRRLVIPAVVRLLLAGIRTLLRVFALPNVYSAITASEWDRR